MERKRIHNRDELKKEMVRILRREGPMTAVHLDSILRERCVFPGSFDPTRAMIVAQLAAITDVIGESKSLRNSKAYVYKLKEEYRWRGPR